jgi:hypothetical protein
MIPASRPTFRARVFSCWNWKCALLSTTARSSVYLIALAHSRPLGRLSIILVEIAYVSLTAGLYAGLQQRALSLRSRQLGNIIVALAVPALAQFLDWLSHRAIGAAVPSRAIWVVSIFALVSALFHLYVMRRGVFLSGRGLSIRDDFRRIPRLLAAFILAPATLLRSLAVRLTRAAESEAAL